MSRSSERAAELAAMLLLAACVGASPGALAEASPPASRLLVDEPCDIETADEAIAARLRCARLHMLRDPADPSAGRFEIAVVVRRSAAPKPGAAPVLMLHGGPGGEWTRWMGFSARDMAPGHDLVAFDMRGGGRSRPVVCEGAFGALIAASVRTTDADAREAERQRVVADCQTEWRDAGLRGEHFGTDRNVADAEALREALGVARWRLLGESYGTTVAAHYVATHPERIEAAVLDSLYPPDEGVIAYPEMQARMIDAIGRDCAADAACAARFPGFGRDALAEAVAALDAEPVRVGRGDSARQMDGFALRQSLAFVGADEAGARSLPFLIDAARRRDADVLAAPLAMFDATAGRTGNLAAMAAIECRDRARHHDLARRDDPSTLLTGLQPGFCEGWASPTDAPLWPYDTAVPLLVLSGGYDSFQPDAAAMVAAIGPAARRVHVPVATHGARGSSVCVRDIVSAFLADPAAALDTACIAKVPAPAFLTEAVPLSGPRGLAMGDSPPLLLVVAAGAAVLALGLVVLAAIWRWRTKTEAATTGRLWPWAAALTSAGSVAGITAAIATNQPPQSAVLLYGLPTSWAWLPWATLLPAILGALVLWRGTPGVAGRIIGVAAIAVTLGLALAGWSPIG